MASESARKAIRDGLAGRRKTPLRVVIAPELADWLWNATPDYMPGGLTGKLQWLIAQHMRDGHAVATVREDQIKRLRTRCPPSYVQADVSTLTNWAVGRYLDILDRYYAERADSIARNVSS